MSVVFVEIVTDQSLASHRIGACSNQVTVTFLLPVHGRYTISSSLAFGVTSVCHAISTDGDFRDGAVVVPLLSNTCPAVQ